MEYKETDWMEVVGVLGFDLSEKLRKRFAGERILVPTKIPRGIIVPIIKDELKNSRYDVIAKKYDLSERTIRRYDLWQIKGDVLISPTGKQYKKYNGDIT